MKELLLSSIISALIGLSAPYIIRFAFYLIRRISKNDFCGEWNTYSVCMENTSPKILEGSIKISKGIFSLYKIVAYENGLKYKGEISLENNHMLLIQKASTEIRSETSCIRLDCSKYRIHDKMHGLWLSYDSDNNLSCGAIMFSKKKITILEAVNDMKLATKCYNEIMLRVEE